MNGKILGGRYYILERLGSGAFGETFLAEDRQMPERFLCVVKQLKPKYNSNSGLEIARELFFKEAKILQLLGNHDRLPRLLAYFEEEKQFYLVEDYIEGITLNELIQPAKSWHEQDVIVLLEDILEVLIFIQEHGVIHRDLKPANLIKRKSDNKIVLLDFGAVKQVTTSSSENEQSIIIGTNGYMPEEQLLGYPKLCSDIYALGKIAIQALTGKGPTTFVKDVNGEIIWRHFTKVSDEFALILNKMVKCKDSDRYSLASEVLNALRALPIHSAPTNWIYQRQKNQNKFNWKQRKTLMTIISLFTLSISAILTIGYSLYNSSEGWKTYQDKVEKFTLKYPQNWEVQKESIVGEVAKFISPLEGDRDRFREEINISVENLKSSSISLEEYTENTLKQISMVLTTEAISPVATTLGSNKAIETVYQVERDGLKLEIFQIWTVVKNKAYIVTYTGAKTQSDRYKPIVKKMLQSWQISNSL
jgi:serine/threonine-protein kinase